MPIPQYNIDYDEGYGCNLVKSSCGEFVFYADYFPVENALRNLVSTIHAQPDMSGGIQGAVPKDPRRFKEAVAEALKLLAALDS